MIKFFTTFLFYLYKCHTKWHTKIQEWLKIAVFEEQVAGIEPVSPAWEAGVLPMNYICMFT